MDQMDGADRIDAKSVVDGVNRVIWVNAVIITAAGKFVSEVPAERLVAQRFFSMPE
jgi:hypothetical protein